MASEHSGEPLSASDPRRVGPYKIQRLLGTGAMGRVYLGQRSDGQLAAVKVVHANLAGIAVFRQRFARELDVVRRVGGDRVARVLDADAEAEQPWIATECVDGPSLHDLVLRNGPLSAGRLRALAADIARALQSIHAAGVVHRDLKPANVLLAVDGPRVIDFGVAHAADASILTNTGHTPGTPAYMAPEQASGLKVGPATDVHALGAVLAFASTGHQPFGEAAPLAVMNRIVNDAPDLSGVAEDDAELRQLIEDCLAKDPSDRPTSARIIEVCDPGTRPDWSDFLTTRAVPGGIPATDPPSPRRRRGRPIGIAVAALAAVLAVLAAAMLHDGSAGRVDAATGRPPSTKPSNSSPSSGGAFPDGGDSTSQDSSTPSTTSPAPSSGSSTPAGGSSSPVAPPPTTSDAAPSPPPKTTVKPPVTTPPVTKPHTSPPPPPPSTPSGSPPATPGTINADIPAWFGVDPNIINLSWSAVADTDTFELDVNGTVTSMAGNQTTYTIHNTVFGQQYCFKLRAHNVYGYSAWNVDECVNGS